MIDINKIKLFLVFIIGLLFGLILHGLIEIIVEWALLNWFKELFFTIFWRSWSLIIVISMIVFEVLGLAIAFGIYKKYEEPKEQKGTKA